jgi:hypothetical protein
MRRDEEAKSLVVAEQDKLRMHPELGRMPHANRPQPRGTVVIKRCARPESGNREGGRTLNKHSRVISASDEDLRRDFGSGKVLFGLPVRLTTATPPDLSDARCASQDSLDAKYEAENQAPSANHRERT